MGTMKGQIKEQGRGLFWFAGVLGLTHIYSIVVGRAFFADGAFFFLKCLTDGFFNDWQRQRLFINMINQFPLLVATRLHLRSYVWLGYLFSWPLFFLPLILVVISSLILLKSNKKELAALPVTAYLLAVTPSLIFAVNPAFLFLALTVFSVSLFLAGGRLTGIKKSGLIAAGVIMFYGHETVMFIFPIFFTYCIYRRWKEKSDNFWLGLSLVYLAGFLFSVRWTMGATTGNDLYVVVVKDILSHGWFYLKETSLLYVVAGGIMLGINTVLGLISNKKNKKTIAGIETGLIILLVAILGWQSITIVFLKQVTAWYDFGLRILLPVGSIATALCLWIPERIIKKIFRRKLAMRVLLIITIFSAIWQINHSWRWGKFYVSAEEYLKSLSYSEVVKTNKIYPGYDFDWPWPALSIILQEGKVRLVVLPKTREHDRWISIPSKPGEDLMVPFSVIKNGEYVDLSGFRYRKL